jgi:hypothetical protein
MAKPIQFKKLLLLMLLFSSSTNVFSEQIISPHIDHQWQNNRYINHKDKTVTDIKTALMWKQCSEGLSGNNCSAGTAAMYTYKAAIERAEGTTFATYSDWRLPNIKELASLAAYDRHYPAINSTLFPNTPLSFNTNVSYNIAFWSSSPSANNNISARRLNFDKGDDGYSNRGISYYVRLVRGGQ